MAIKLGHVGHFCLAVKNPKRSAAWWVKTVGLKIDFAFPAGVVLGNQNFSMVLMKGTPRPEAVDHISFHLRTMRELRAALSHLKRRNVNLEDPGDEIGPEAPGSRNWGLWFHDPDGYRWEFSVLNAVPAGRKA